MKRRGLAYLTGFAGIAACSITLLAGAERLRNMETPDFAQTGEKADVPESGGNADEVVVGIETRPVRSIEPDTFEFPVARNAQGLERIAARTPVDAAKLATGPEPVRLARPRVLSAGLLAFGAQHLELTGVQPTPVTQRCAKPAGGDWPCGMAARTGFLQFIRDRTINCDLPSGTWQGTATAECSIGAISLGGWLVERGWAQAEPGSALAEAGNTAKANRLGLYGDDPRDPPPSSRPMATDESEHTGADAG